MIMNHPFVILALALVGLYATSAHHKVYSPVFLFMLKPRSRFFVISGLFPLFESRSAGGLSGVLAHSEL